MHCAFDAVRAVYGGVVLTEPHDECLNLLTLALSGDEIARDGAVSPGGEP